MKPSSIFPLLLPLLLLLFGRQAAMGVGLKPSWILLTLLLPLRGQEMQGYPWMALICLIFIGGQAMPHCLKTYMLFFPVLLHLKGQEIIHSLNSLSHIVSFLREGKLHNFCFSPRINFPFLIFFHLPHLPFLFCDPSSIEMSHRDKDSVKFESKMAAH